MTAEITWKPDWLRAYELASMRPRPNDRGNKIVVVRPLPKDAASMRPRPNDRGNIKIAALRRVMDDWLQ